MSNRLIRLTLFAITSALLVSQGCLARAEEDISHHGSRGREDFVVSAKNKSQQSSPSIPEKPKRKAQRRHKASSTVGNHIHRRSFRSFLPVALPRPEHNPLCDTPTFNPTTLTNTNAFTTTHNYETTCGHTPTKPKPHTPKAKPTPQATKTPAVVITREEFAKLNIKSGEITVGPPTDYFPTDFDIIYYTIPYTQTLNTTLLGQNVTIKATPTSYTWHLGDGYTLTTTRPGRPFPNKDITHRYYNEGWADAYLETTYTGQYQVNNGEWKPIDGTITVTSEKRSFYIMRLLPYLGSENHTPAPIQVPPRDGSNESKPDQYARHIPLDKEKPL
ncbi:hypothetical protein ACUH88_00050 [Dermabacteraceae bacterium P13095]